VADPSDRAREQSHPAAAPEWGASTTLYNAFAPAWDGCFDDTNHRNTYDRLAWEYVEGLLPLAPAHIIDVGCGTGRWAAKFLALGHRVTGIEPAPEMVGILAAKGLAAEMAVITDSMETALLPPASADLVVAMGSVQYARDPALMIRRFFSWTKPGGRVFVCVDSLIAVVLELLSLQRVDEALGIVSTGRGVFTHAGESADLHVCDRRTLEGYFAAAGLVELDCRGLLVSMSALGRKACSRAIASDQAGVLALERKLAQFPTIADIGKHIIVCGRRPLPSAPETPTGTG
jgi:SAM-dependent methyltransferase